MKFKNQNYIVYNISLSSGPKQLFSLLHKLKNKYTNQYFKQTFINFKIYHF